MDEYCGRRGAVAPCPGGIEWGNRFPCRLKKFETHLQPSKAKFVIVQADMTGRNFLRLLANQDFVTKLLKNNQPENCLEICRIITRL